MILEGKISVKAALLGGVREVRKVYISRKPDRDTKFVIKTAQRLNVPVESITPEEAAAIASGTTHGGILAEAGPRVYQDIGDVISPEGSFVVLAEGIEDPYNLGYIMRTLYSAGCTGLIVPERSWDMSWPVMIRSSAGASEYIRLVMTKDPRAALRRLKEKGLYVYAAMREDAVSYYEADFRKDIVICLGGEMRGLSAGVLAECDRNIYIPYANDFRAALNAAGAAAALGFEVMRQRMEGKKDGRDPVTAE